MHYEPVGAILADRITREHLGSALPNAPIIQPRSTRMRHHARARLASGLRRLASALEPTAPQVSAGPVTRPYRLN